MPAAGHELKLTAERFDASARTDVLTSQGTTTTTGSTRTTVSDVKGFDEQDRTRVRLDYEWAPAAGALDRLDADQNDPVYLSGNAGIDAPVEMDDTAISPRIGAVVRVTLPLSAYGQYARGFRAPPFSYVNNGFTNIASGYTTLPNGNLRPELSDDFELGLRGTFKGADFSAGVFDNRYSDFIETVS